MDEFHKNNIGVGRRRKVPHNLPMNFLKTTQQFIYAFFRIYNLSYSSENLTLTTKFKQIEISFNDISEFITFKESLSFTTLIINSNSELRRIKVTKKFTGNELQNLNISISNFKQIAITRHALNIEEKYSLFKDLWDSGKYLRTEKILGFIKSIQSILNPKEEYFWRKLSSQKAKEQLFYLQNLDRNYSNDLKIRNDEFISLEIEKYKSLFDTIEKMPLTDSQRRACVINEENNLVLAGAGSGKTSVMVGRCAYLIESKLALPEEILVIAFNNKAVAELEERVKDRIPDCNISAFTFHGVGRHIIYKVTGSKGEITDLSDGDILRHFITETVLTELSNNYDLRMEVLTTLHPEQLELKSEFQFETQSEYDHYIKENNYLTLNKEKVKSFGEIEIANYLFKNGINYKYEAPYEINTTNDEYSQYCPDFYLPDHKIYIEYFGTDKEGNTAPFINKEEYARRMQWKRQCHAVHKTIMVELFYSDLKEGLLLSKLEDQLDKLNVKRNTEGNKNQFNLINEFLQNFKVSDTISKLFSTVEANNITFKEAFERLSEVGPSKREITTLKLARIIYEKYLEKIKQDGKISYHQMITLGFKYLENKSYSSKWKHILIDEFQDISDIRLELLNALKKSCPATLFCVGDDWQSIYGFTGSNIKITTNFSEMFKNNFITNLDQTFRFNNKILNVATSFVIQNPTQFKKEIKSNTNVDGPKIQIELLIDSKNILGKINLFLEEVVNKQKKQSVMILYRNSTVLGSFLESRPEDLFSKFPTLNFSYSTIHSSKGLEADYVIILGLTGGDNGFPSEKDFTSIITKIKKTDEIYPYAEERRLFYVALTRAKHNVLLISDYKNPSIFIRELLNGNYEVKSDQAKKTCPRCISGYLMIKTNKDKRQFLGCTNFNEVENCRYSESIKE